MASDEVWLDPRYGAGHFKLLNQPVDNPGFADFTSFDPQFDNFPADLTLRPWEETSEDHRARQTHQWNVKACDIQYILSSRSPSFLNEETSNLLKLLWTPEAVLHYIDCPFADFPQYGVYNDQSVQTYKRDVKLDPIPLDHIYSSRVAQRHLMHDKDRGRDPDAHGPCAIGIAYWSSFHDRIAEMLINAYMYPVLEFDWYKYICSIALEDLLAVNPFFGHRTLLELAILAGQHDLIQCLATRHDFFLHPFFAVPDVVAFSFNRDDVRVWESIFNGAINSTLSNDNSLKMGFTAKAAISLMWDRFQLDRMRKSSFILAARLGAKKCIEWGLKNLPAPSVRDADCHESIWSYMTFNGNKGIAKTLSERKVCWTKPVYLPFHVHNAGFFAGFPVLTMANPEAAAWLCNFYQKNYTHLPIRQLVTDGLLFVERCPAQPPRHLSQNEPLFVQKAIMLTWQFPLEHRYITFGFHFNGGHLVRIIPFSRLPEKPDRTRGTPAVLCDRSTE